MSVRPCAVLTTDFPDDMVEADGEILEFGGRLVTDAIIDALQRLGYAATEPQDMREMGWDFDVTVEKKRVWMSLRCSGEENESILITQYYPGFSLFKKANEQPYAQMLNALNTELRKDARFRDIRWKFEWEFRQDGGGQPTPGA